MRYLDHICLITDFLDLCEWPESRHGGHMLLQEAASGLFWWRSKEELRELARLQSTQR